MKDKKKEKKLVIKDEMEVDRKKVISTLENFQSNVTIAYESNQYYRDEYYDDEQKTLLNEGGSLKLRTGTKSVISANKSIVMRRKTTDPRKMKITIWDEVEIAAYQSQNFFEVLSPMEPFFPNFDFSKIVTEPVLVCSTFRSVYCLSKNKTVIAKMYMDSIKYESENRFASDEIIKFRISDEVEENELYDYLQRCLPEYYLIESSRYERALERLSKSSKTILEN